MGTEADMSQRPQLTMYYDGLCPLCKREVAWLKRWNKRELVAFEDFTAQEFNASAHGFTEAQLVKAMHAKDADGKVLVGVAAFRRAYSLLGIGWMVNWTNWPILKPVADLGYRIFAWIRPRLQGKPQPCEGDRCEKPLDGRFGASR